MKTLIYFAIEEFHTIWWFHQQSQCNPQSPIWVSVTHERICFVIMKFHKSPKLWRGGENVQFYKVNRMLIRSLDAIGLPKSFPSWRDQHDLLPNWAQIQFQRSASWRRPGLFTNVITTQKPIQKFHNFRFYTELLPGVQRSWTLELLNSWTIFDHAPWCKKWSRSS